MGQLRPALKTSDSTDPAAGQTVRSVLGLAQGCDQCAGVTVILSYKGNRCHAHR